MNRAIAPLLVLVMSLGLLRCATITYHEKLGDYGREVREFEKLESAEKLYHGTAVQQAVVKNKPYYHLQFEGPLKGKSRFLDIYIPHDDRDEKIIITESDAGLAGTNKAFLLVERTCCSEGYKEIFERYNAKTVAAPLQVIKRVLHADAGSKDFPVFFIKLSFTNVKKFYVHHVIWNLNGSGLADIKEGFHMEQPYSLIDVRWNERNPGVIGLIKVGYIAPVLADIISSPIQLIGVIIYFAMGGAVK